MGETYNTYSMLEHPLVPQVTGILSAHLSLLVTINKYRFSSVIVDGLTRVLKTADKLASRVFQFLCLG